MNSLNKFSKDVMKKIDELAHKLDLCKIKNDELRQDLNDARSNWESATMQLNEICAQRDMAWEELREIREAIKANPEESTADEVKRIMVTIKKIEESQKCHK